MNFLFFANFCLYETKIKICSFISKYFNNVFINENHDGDDILSIYL